MHGYVKTSGCREVYLLNYFGDVDAKPCGKCDNCVKKITQYEPSSRDIQKLFEQLIDESKNIDEATFYLKWEQTKIDKVLQYMVMEEVINSVEDKPGYYHLVE
jgi:ATP-dependent DNA helicase RecQ